MRRRELASASTVAPANKKSRSNAGFRPSNGETRTRTGDTTIFSRVLYQLSYLAEPRTG